MRKQPLQAEDRLVEMEQRALGVATLVEQREPRLCHVIGSLGAELGQRDDRHRRVPGDLRG